MPNFTISVILAVHNEESYVRPTIQSVLSQTFSDFELIVVNDASTDKTKEALDGLASTDQRVRIISNQKLMGLASSINRGIDVAKGRYIARIDAGDIAMSDRLQKQFEYMEMFKDVFVLGSWAYIINTHGRIIGEWKVPRDVDDGVFYKKNGVLHPTVLIRKGLFEEVGKYDPYFNRAEDYELWARTLKNRLKINNMQEFLTSMMERKTGVTVLFTRNMRKDTFRIKFKYLRYFFSLRNLISTLRSFFSGYILPLSIANYLARKLDKYLSGRVFQES